MMQQGVSFWSVKICCGIGPNAWFVVLQGKTLYAMFGLSGVTDITAGVDIPKEHKMDLQCFFVAVVVKAIRCTAGDKTLPDVNSLS